MSRQLRREAGAASLISAIVDQSRRQELSEYLDTGRLRDAVAGDLREAAQDLLIDVVARYCDPPREARGKGRGGMARAGKAVQKESVKCK